MQNQVMTPQQEPQIILTHYNLTGIMHEDLELMHEALLELPMKRARRAVGMIEQQFHMQNKMAKDKMDQDEIDRKKKLQDAKEPEVKDPLSSDEGKSPGPLAESN